MASGCLEGLQLAVWWWYGGPIAAGTVDRGVELRRAPGSTGTEMRIEFRFGRSVCGCLVYWAILSFPWLSRPSNADFHTAYSPQLSGELEA